MPKYRVTIEIETCTELPFPVEAILLADMQAQVESLEDGTMENFQTMACVKSGTVTIIEENSK